MILVKFQGSTLDQSHHLLVKLSCKNASENRCSIEQKRSMLQIQYLQYAFCSQYCSWARSHRGRHYGCTFYIYMLLLYSNTRSIEAE